MARFLGQDGATAVGAFFDKQTGGYNAATNTPDLDTSPAAGTIKNGYSYAVTAAGNFFTEAVEIGDVVVACKDDPAVLGDWLILQNNIDGAITSADIDALAELNAIVTDATLADVSGTAGSLVKYTGSGTTLGDSAMDEDITESGSITITGKHLKMGGAGSDVYTSDVVSITNSNTYINYVNTAIDTYIDGNLLLRVRSGLNAQLNEDLEVKGDGVTAGHIGVFHQDGTNAACIFATNIRKIRTQNLADHSGVFSMNEEQALESLTADNTTVTSGALAANTTYEVTVAGGALADFSNLTLTSVFSDTGTTSLASGALAQGTIFKTGASGTPTNYDGANLMPVLPNKGNFIEINSDTATAADRTRTITSIDARGGQELTIRFLGAGSFELEQGSALATIGGANLTFVDNDQATVYFSENENKWIQKHAKINVS